MKKIVLMAAALFAFAAVSFAKAPKVSGWKDVAKIANKNKLEVVNDEDIWYVAKGNGGKDFAFFAVKRYTDAKVTLAMSCINGEVFSKTTVVDTQDGQPEPTFVLGQNDEKATLVNGGDLTFAFNSDGLAAWSDITKEQRAKLLDEVANEYGLVVPKN